MADEASFAGQPMTPTPDDAAWLRAVVEGTASSVGDDFLRKLVRHLSLALDASHAFVAEFLAADRVRTLAYWKAGQIVPNIDFELRGTPCQDVLGGGLCHYPSGVQAKFSGEVGIESYLGVPLLSHEGTVLGHLCVFDERPMPADPRQFFMFQIFAARAAAELDRLRAESRLRESEDRFRDLFEEAPIACVHEGLDSKFIRANRAAERILMEQEQARLHAQNLYLQEEIKSVHNFEEIVGGSPALRKVLERVNCVARTDASVLIWGETGTGKELIARAIHSNSARASKPFIKINCAALPAGLVESELFGHERGAFSGAIQRRIGRFELANKGTIFLDEIGEVPKDVQVKLLRVLQEREFERVGGANTIKCDVRFIAATNRPLEKAVQDGDFRADLYYRLNVFPINMPALRERWEDIPLLTHFFVHKYGARIGRRIDSVEPQTLQRLAAYPWPGNIRELENIIERAMILSAAPVLRIDADILGLPIRLAAESETQESLDADEDESVAAGNLNRVQRVHILNVLRDTNWVIEGQRGAAGRLGVKPATLRHRMKKLGIARSSH